MGVDKDAALQSFTLQGWHCCLTLPAADTRDHAGLISLSGPGLELWQFPASDVQVLGLWT